MRLPTNTWVTCNSDCHGYLATDYSWHLSPTNYTRDERVFAVEKGKVVSVGPLGACGIHIEYTGQSGRRYRCCHMRTVNVKVGQTISEGDVLGMMGETGEAFGVHLHLIMWVNGTRVDPDSTIRSLIKKEGGSIEGMATKSQIKKIYRLAFGRDPESGAYDTHSKVTLAQLLDNAYVSKERLGKLERAGVKDDNWYARVMDLLEANVETAKQLAILDDKLKEVQDQIDDLRSELTAKDKEIDAASKENEELRKKLQNCSGGQKLTPGQHLVEFVKGLLNAIKRGD